MDSSPREHTQVTDEDGWSYTTEPVHPNDPIRLPGLVRRAIAHPRILSVGAIDNTVEVRMSRDLYEQIKEIVHARV